MTTSLSDPVMQSEAALLGSVLLDNSQWPHTAGISVDDFSISSHRIIFGQMAAMFQDQRPVDSVTLLTQLSRINQLEAIGDAAYLAVLTERALPENLPSYVRIVRSASRDRRVARQIERLAAISASQSPNTEASLQEHTQVLQDLLSVGDFSDQWKSLFHTFDEINNVPPTQFAIEGFLQEDGITLIGGLAGHGKTLCMLAMVRALLEGGKLFHHFAVTKPARRVIYLIPEAGLRPFAARLKTFHLEQYIQNDRLYCRTLSAKGELPLTDQRLLEAAKNSDIFLDTAIRFMAGDENNAAEQKQFADSLFALQRAGARSITGAHHSPKSFGKENFMTLENVLRGSGDIGAMLVTCWGLRQIDSSSNSIYVKNVKPRDFAPCEPFIIQGRPSISETGYFELTHPPGLAGELGDHRTQAGRPPTRDKADKLAKAQEMKRQGYSYRDIASALGVSKSAISKWLASETSTNCPSVDVI